MNSTRRRLAAILDALGVPPSARRPVATSASPACESLEGRQLLASGAGLQGLGMAGMGMADVSSQRTGPFAEGHPTDLGTGAPGGDMATASLGGPADASLMAAGPIGGPAGQDQGPGMTSTGGRADSDALEQLRADTQAIRDKSQVTPAMQYAVTAAEKAVKAAVTTTPDPVAQAILRANTKVANANPGGPTAYQTALVHIARDVVYASQGVGSALIAQLGNAEMAVYVASGVTAADEATLAADRAAVQADLAKPSPVATTPTTPTTATTTTSTPSTTTASATPMTAPSGMAGGVSGQSGLPSGGDFGMTAMPWAGGRSWSATMAPTPGTDATPTAEQVALRAALQTLQVETQAVHDKSQVTPAMEALVRKDLETIRAVATAAPGATAQATLEADLKAARATDGGPTAAQAAQIQADQDAVYLSQGVNAMLIAKLDADRAAIKAASGITASDESDLAAARAAVKAASDALAASQPSKSSSTDATATTDAATTTTATATPPSPGTRPGMDFRLMPGERGDFDLGRVAPLA